MGAIQRPLPDNTTITGRDGNVYSTRGCAIVVTVIVVLQRRRGGYFVYLPPFVDC